MCVYQDIAKCWRQAHQMLHTLVKAHLKLEEVDGSRNLAAPGLRRACGGSLSCRDRCGSFGCTWPAELAVYTPKVGRKAHFRQCSSRTITQQPACSILQALHAVKRHLAAWQGRQLPSKLRLAARAWASSGTAHRLELVLLLIPLSLGIRQHGPCMVSPPLFRRQRRQCVQRRGRCRQPGTGSHHASRSTAW